MGELSSFDRLTLQHLNAAYNLALWLVRSESDAEDIVQESYMRAFRGFHGFPAPMQNRGCSRSYAIQPIAGSAIAGARQM
jgi:DNA-directed RNA polymerase specialized sigma24 family protein